MLWSGVFYAALMISGFIAVKVLKHVPAYQTINPGYWSPDTLFNLNSSTGGFSIEDLLFMIFFGGIAGVIYELVTRTTPSDKSVSSGIKVSIPFAVLVAALVAHTGANLMYSIVAFGYAGACVVCLQRPDLVRRSLIGGFSFLVFYIMLYLIFLLFFPSFVAQNYHLNNVSGTLVLGIPFEEYLFAFGFGWMWSVIYPYMRNRA